ncbi:MULTISPECIES: acyl carrier protein [Streptomyces]|uniref:acyl carrier protein n=1 Tax=Streptomyces TaxID=1883 RepID=UPI001E507F41|nr:MULTISPECIES: acyl carrier protein [Streptomyces]UFQ17181.1 acyl carrier protein [Streptomyces huasconensis]WCL86781.1 acyl carrier protein [Streptomyces sp. JCM 35825]
MVEITPDLRDRVKKIVCDILEVEPGELTETTHFYEELGVDSLAVIEIMTAIEDSLGITIEQDKAKRMVSLAAIHDVLAEA